MGFFSKSTEELAQEAEADFWMSPPGQARRAKHEGSRLFQISIPLSKTIGSANFWTGTYASSAPTKNAATMIEAIENEGWRLDNVGYVYRVTGSVTVDKTFSSGQREATNGEIVGIYIFRAIDG